MSHQAVNWAIEQRAGGPAPKATLWSIANYANEHWCAWPSQKTICTESEQSQDAVQRWIKAIEAQGLVRRIPLRFAGRRSIDFFVLRPSPYFESSMVEIEPLLPRGYSPFVVSERSRSSQSEPENATANDGSVEAAGRSPEEASVDAAANATADVAANATALERQQEGTLEPEEPLNQNVDSARARVGYSCEAAAIADEIAKLAGVDSTKHAAWFIAGPALIVQRWLDSGYLRWHLIEGVRRGMARRDGPPDDIRYFKRLWQRVRGESEQVAPGPEAPSQNTTTSRQPRPGSREDRQERTSHVISKLRELSEDGSDASDEETGGRAGGQAFGRLSLPKPA